MVFYGIVYYVVYKQLWKYGIIKEPTTYKFITPDDKIIIKDRLVGEFSFIKENELEITELESIILRGITEPDARTIEKLTHPPKMYIDKIKYFEHLEDKRLEWFSNYKYDLFSFNHFISEIYKAMCIDIKFCIDTIDAFENKIWEYYNYGVNVYNYINDSYPYVIKSLLETQSYAADSIYTKSCYVANTIIMTPTFCKNIFAQSIISTIEIFEFLIEDCLINPEFYINHKGPVLFFVVTVGWTLGFGIFGPIPGLERAMKMWGFSEFKKYLQRKYGDRIYPSLWTIKHKWPNVSFVFFKRLMYAKMETNEAIRFLDYFDLHTPSLNYLDDPEGYSNACYFFDCLNGDASKPWYLYDGTISTKVPGVYYADHNIGLNLILQLCY